MPSATINVPSLLADAWPDPRLTAGGYRLLLMLIHRSMYVQRPDLNLALDDIDARVELCAAPRDVARWAGDLAVAADATWSILGSKPDSHSRATAWTWSNAVLMGLAMKDVPVFDHFDFSRGALNFCFSREFWAPVVELIKAGPHGYRRSSYARIAMRDLAHFKQSLATARFYTLVNVIRNRRLEPVGSIGTTTLARVLGCASKQDGSPTTNPHRCREIEEAARRCGVEFEVDRSPEGEKWLYIFNSVPATSITRR